MGENEKHVGRLYQYHNCWLLKNHKLVKDDFWVRDGKIMNPEKLFFDEMVSADSRVDCKGAIIAPGLIDVQINGNCLELFLYSDVYNYIF